jgi:hypothetical protein
MAKGVGLRLLSRRGSWVQIPPSAPTSKQNITYFSLGLRTAGFKLLHNDFPLKNHFS